MAYLYRWVGDLALRAEGDYCGKGAVLVDLCDRSDCG